MNRALRAATVGVLLMTPVALTACGAGQVDQTASQVRDKTGPSAKIGDLYLRQVQLAPPSGGSYAAGGDAELTMSIANGGATDDALVAIRGEGFSGVRVTGTGTSATPTAPAAAATSATTSAAATGTPTPSATSLPVITPGTVPPATATATAPGAPTAAVTSPPATPTASSTVNIPLPAHQTVFLGQNAPTVTLAGLDRSLTSGQLLKITFTFRHAGEVTLDVSVAAPTEAAVRSTTFDFSEQPTPVFGKNG